MDRGWYARFSLVLILTVGSWFLLWPTLNDWGWVGAPAWVTENIDRRITLGLDIQGGLRLMYTVDMEAAIEDRRDARMQQIYRRLGEKMDLVEDGEAPNEQQIRQIRERVRARPIGGEPRGLRIEFTRAEDLRLFDRDLIGSFSDLTEESRTDRVVTLMLTQESIDALQTVAVEQAKETIKNRITELGISEANIRARDIDIIVEVPGADEQQFDRIREIIGQTARLEFKIVDEANTFVATLNDVPEGIERRGTFLTAENAGACPPGVEPDADDGQCTAHTRLEHYVQQLRSSNRVPEGRTLALARYESENVDSEAEIDPDAPEADTWRTWVLYDQPPNGSDPIGGEHLEDASVGNDPESGKPVVLFEMNGEGARRMADLTSNNLRKGMAIVLDDEVKSVATIQSRISARGQITLGGYRPYNAVLNEANDLVIVLRAGALPAPIVPQNEQLIGPTLGRDSVVSGATGALIGILLVMIAMALYYVVAGVVADVMVLLNLLMLAAAMAFFNNDLTLPGLAGIALTIGMAVDANVLITERMREELRTGKTARAAVDQGFRRAFWSIFDSQLTTFIAGVVLYQFGSPEIQGFAKTLMIGILTSIFTGVFCAHVAFDWIVKGLKVQRLRIG